MHPSLEALRFSYESELLGALQTRLGGMPEIDQDQTRRLLDTRRRDLLGDGIRLTADLLPEIFKAWQDCLSRFGGGISGELFIVQNPSYNAAVFSGDSSFDIQVHSGLIRDFTTAELRFVFGHELGHVVFSHSRYPVRDLTAWYQDKDETAARFLSKWSRASEISADRIGMVCCGSLSAAAGALFKTACGLADIGPDHILRSLREQYDALSAQLGSIGRTAAWVRTHPMVPIRFKALELAALDLISMGKQPDFFSDRGFRQVDRQIAGLLRTLDSLP